MKPTSAEEEYFLREESEKLYRLYQEQEKLTSTEQIAQQKVAHHMHCGKCGSKMQTIRFRDVDIEKCYRCGAVLLDDGELEKLAGDESANNWLRGFFTSIRPAVKK